MGKIIKIILDKHYSIVYTYIMTDGNDKYKGGVGMVISDVVGVEVGNDGMYIVVNRNDMEYRIFAGSDVCLFITDEYSVEVLNTPSK